MGKESNSQILGIGLTSSNSLNGVQALRFLAASMVLLLHSTFYIQTRIEPSFPRWETGHYGVHIFFVISGFVMMLSSGVLSNQPSNWKDFASQRLIRIVPLYWLVNIVKVLILLKSPTIMRIDSNPMHILLSILFIPARSGSGVLEPFYGVGWTLNFEMLFYAAFTITLWARRDPITWLAPVFLGLTVASYFKTDHWPAFSFYCKPVAINFVWGMLIAKLYKRMPLLDVRWAFGFTLFGLLTIFISPNAPVLGLQYAALVMGVIYLEPHLRGRIPKWVIKCGAASYALYLLHPMIGPAVLMLVVRIFGSVPSIIIAAIWIVSLLTSLIVFSWIESPISRRLKRLVQDMHRVPAIS